jgi:predicted phosphodiesterase
MRTIVFSDSHGDVCTMECILKRFAPDLALHLGDCVDDVYKLREIFPHILFEYVKGNCAAFIRT